MSPLRIIVIAILIYFAIRLITGGGKKKAPSGGRQQDQSSGKMPASDVLEEDPICKKLVPRQQAVEYQHQGKTHYFCSNECCKVFRTQQGEH